jgi:superfamily II DNA/RNA helicase
MSFSRLGLMVDLQRAGVAQGCVRATPAQAKGTSVNLESRDVFAGAPAAQRRQRSRSRPNSASGHVR